VSFLPTLLPISVTVSRATVAPPGIELIEFTASTALRTSGAILGDLTGIVDLVLRTRIPDATR